MMQKESRRRKRGSSPLWNRALERYHDELSENDSYNDILNESGSMQDVLDYAKSFSTHLPREQSALLSLNRLGPIFKFLDDFSAAVAICSGADARLTAFIWGSIRLMITLSSTAGNHLQNVVDMLEELSLTLPQFRTYEHSLPMTRALETSLIDLYTEVICFYARTILFFRNNSNIAVQKQAWIDLQGDFGRTLKRIRHMSSIVKNEADIARMSMDKNRYQEVLDLVQDFKDSKLADKQASVKCFLVPHDPDPRFSGRAEALHAVTSALEADDRALNLKTFALYGMGGVGKTQIALQYAKQSRAFYDAVIWIAADTPYRIGQTARDAAQALMLIKTEAELKDTNGATSKLRNWLGDTSCSWLMVLDNADDVEIVKQVWPSGATGSILLTSRDFNAASHPASAGYFVKPFDNVSGAQIMLELLGHDRNDVEYLDDAIEITKTLGGLPLAINQIASFISQRRLPLKDFLGLYDRNSARIDSKKSRLTHYELTLETVWELSLSRLSGDAAHLQRLLAFFEADVIDETILCNGAAAVTDSEFKFLFDELDLSDAEEALLQASLIDKNGSDRTLSVHRLVQAAVIRRMPVPERQKYLSIAIELLSYNFTDKWSTGTDYEFKEWNKDAWVRHERCLPHVTNLVKQSRKYDIQPEKPERFGKLLFPYIEYLKMKEYFNDAQDLLELVRNSVQDNTCLQFASICNLDGLLSLNINRPAEAIKPFEEALLIREKLLSEDDPLVAWGYNNLGLAYTETGKFPEAWANHTKAMEKRLRNDIGRIGNSYSNISSLCLRLGRPDDAEEYLYKCPALKGFTDDTFLSKNNPRFAGDMVLLSRIRQAQGKKQEALRLATKALAYRRKLLGNRFAVCDSLYDVATYLEDAGNNGSALVMLEDLVQVAEGLPGNLGEAYLARGNYKLSTIYTEFGRRVEGEACKKRANELREKLQPGENSAFDESKFSGLCPWMLW